MDYRTSVRSRRWHGRGGRFATSTRCERVVRRNGIQTYEWDLDLTCASAGGLNGIYTLNTVTLTDDGERDRLRGNGGRDLFFATPTDRLMDRRSDEDLFAF